MHRPLLFMLTLGLGLLLTSCAGQVVKGSGAVTQVVHDIKSINRLEVSGIGRLILVNGHANQLTVNAQRELQSYVTVRQSGQTLTIKTKRHVNYDAEVPFEYVLVTDGIEEISASGSVEIISSEYDTAKLKISASGATTIDLTVQTNDLAISSNGALNGYVSGFTNKLVVKTSGAADLNAYDLKTKSIEIRSMGASDIYTSASEYIKTSTFGASRVHYNENPVIEKGFSIGDVSVTSN